LMDASFNTLRKATAEELLARLQTCSPAFFEQVVVRLLRAMGYGGVTGEASVTGKSGDGGIDGIIKKESWASMWCVSRLNDETAPWVGLSFKASSGVWTTSGRRRA